MLDRFRATTLYATITAPTATNQFYTVTALPITGNTTPACLSLTIPVINCPPDPCTAITTWRTTYPVTSLNSILANPFLQYFANYWTLEQRNTIPALPGAPTADETAVMAQLQGIVNNINTGTATPFPLFYYTVNTNFNVSITQLNTMLFNMTAPNNGYNCTELWECWQASVINYASMYLATNATTRPRAVILRLHHTS